MLPLAQLLHSRSKSQKPKREAQATLSTQFPPFPVTQALYLLAEIGITKKEAEAKEKYSRACQTTQFSRPIESQIFQPVDERIHSDLQDTLKNNGLSIRGYEFTAEDCGLIVKKLSANKEATKFLNLAYSTGLKYLLTKLKDLRSPNSTPHPKVTKVCFAGNGEGDLDDLVSVYVEFATLLNAEVLVLTDVRASNQGLESLRKAFKGAEQMKSFKQLEIFHEDIDERGCEILADIAADYLKSRGAALFLSICYCNLTDGHLLKLKEKLNSTKLAGFNICGNRLLTKDGFRAVGEIVDRSEVPVVTLQHCNVDAEKFGEFNLGAGIDSPRMKIETLNVANNPNLTKEGADVLKKTVESFDVRNLNIASCALYDLDFGTRKFESLDISGNRKCVTITKLAISATKTLFMRNCMLHSSELENVKNAMAENGCMLEAIDLSDNGKRRSVKSVQHLLQCFAKVAESVTVG